MFQFSKERDRSLSMISTKMILATILLISLIGNPTTGKQTVQDADCLPGCSCNEVVLGGVTSIESDCSGASFNELPVNFLSVYPIRALQMSNNNLTHLKKDEFEQRNFASLGLLVLTQCKIQTIHVRAFHGMGSLNVLNLSGNNISALEIGTFDPITGLCVLLLNNNNLTVLSSGLFKNFQSLFLISLSNNQLTTIEPRAFFNLPFINRINLDFNHLRVLKRDSFQQLSPNLIFILNNNSWNCDCELKEFYDFANIKLDKTTVCEGPERLEDHKWGELNSDDFACAPSIVNFAINYRKDSNHTYLEMGCKAIGIPPPKIYWMEEAKIVKEHIESYNRTHDGLWVNLVISNVSMAHDHQYTCVVENRAATIEQTYIMKSQTTKKIIYS